MRNAIDFAAIHSYHRRDPTLLPAPSDPQPFHVSHKVPPGDGPYVKAKHAQLVERNPERAISLFRIAIEARDRMDSALKDMAIVMKQQNRSEEAIQAIVSLRDRCSEQAQESLENILLDLYKSCGRLDDQIVLITRRLNLFHQGMAFNGRRTKTARSQGKKFQVSVEQEATRLLGNLGWVYMQKCNYVAAEAVYRKALSIEIDNNKICNLGICLMKQGRLEEARAVLQSVSAVVPGKKGNFESHLKSYERARELLPELQASLHRNRIRASVMPGGLESGTRTQEFDGWPCWKLWQIPSTSSDSSDWAAIQTKGYEEFDLFCQSTVDRLQHQQGQPSNSELASLDDGRLKLRRERVKESSKTEEINGMVVAAAVAVATASVARGRDEAALMLACGQDDEDDMAMEGDISGLSRSPSASKSFMSELQQQRGFSCFANRRRLRVFQDLTVVGNA